ncbi:MAG: heavy metal translocating P-type ATPase metal-binding domain-containing protein, partial [Bacteroidota bacterium]
MEKQTVIDKGKQLEKVSCYHCGESCPSPAIHLEEKYFCCDGCKTVYEILNAHDLCTYYE